MFSTLYWPLFMGMMLQNGSVDPELVSCASAVPDVWLCPAMPSTRLLAWFVSVYSSLSFIVARLPMSGVVAPPPPPPVVVPPVPAPPQPETIATTTAAAAQASAAQIDNLTRILPSQPQRKHATRRCPRRSISKPVQRTCSYRIGVEKLGCRLRAGTGHAGNIPAAPFAQ